MKPQQQQEWHVPWQKIHPWNKIAYEHGKANLTWFSVGRDTPEYKAWDEYFQKLGWAPLNFATLANDKEMTLPCQWPQWMPSVPA